jgi:Fanconi anemia group J protein
LKICPYFTARELARESDIVFCPYTYLIDPAIRAAMGVQIEGNILIFDEAHNIEDVSR